MPVKEPLVILDFETTGLSPDFARIIEVGAVLIEENRIVDSFSQLMNPGFYIPSVITGITGITNKMVEDMPSPEEVMPLLHHFIGNRPIMAHNASFDKKFLIAEMARADLAVRNPFLCTLKLSRRLIHDASSYRLGFLAGYLDLDTEETGQMHRALCDVKVTFQLWKYLQNAVVRKSGLLEHELRIYHEISRRAKNNVQKFLENISEVSCPAQSGFGPGEK